MGSQRLWSRQQPGLGSHLKTWMGNNQLPSSLTWSVFGMWPFQHGSSQYGNYSIMPVEERIFEQERSHILHTLITEVASHHFCQTLLVRSKSQGQPTLNRKGYIRAQIPGSENPWRTCCLPPQLNSRTKIWIRFQMPMFPTVNHYTLLSSQTN